MGNPPYDARREAERVEAEAEKASHAALKAAADTFLELMNGTAFFSVEPGNVGWIVRIRRD